MSRATVCLCYHFDAVSTWLWAFDAWDMPSRQSRGVFGAEVAAPRLLDLHSSFGIPSTWCIPGHTIESFPDICAEIHERGHDIQHHGWTHKNPSTYENRDEELADLERGIEAIVELTGKRPTGYSSPAWNFSEHTIELLLEHGFEWDSSAMASDFRPYYLHGGSRAPADGPFDRGSPTDIVELPASWQRDDFPPLTYTWSRPHRMGYVSEDSLFQRWFDQFDWMVDHVDDGVFILTLHPQVIGQAHRIARLEDLIQHMQHTSGTTFQTMTAATEEFRDAYPDPETSRDPYFFSHRQ